MGLQLGMAPAHIKPKEFNQPQDKHPLLIILRDVEGPRKPSCNFQYSLITILFTTLVTVLCGAKNWEDIFQVGEEMMEWIDRYVDISRGIPSSKTLKRLMGLIPTETLEQVLDSFGRILKESDKLNMEPDVVAIDGKTLRGSRGVDDKIRPLHLLDAWRVDHKICLGQISVEEKSNEMTAFLKLIEALE